MDVVVLDTDCTNHVILWHDTREPVREGVWHELPWGGRFRVYERRTRLGKFPDLDTYELVIELEGQIPQVVDFGTVREIQLRPFSCELVSTGE